MKKNHCKHCSREVDECADTDPQSLYYPECCDKCHDYLLVRRRVSFRGRKLWGRAYWKYKDQKNVVTFYLNKLTKDIKESFGIVNFEQYFIYNFTLLDFHEWLHLWIRRKSGEKNTYIVTDECEDWINQAEEELALCIIDDVFTRSEIQDIAKEEVPLIPALEIGLK